MINRKLKVIASGTLMLFAASCSRAPLASSAPTASEPPPTPAPESRPANVTAPHPVALEPIVAAQAWIGTAYKVSVQFGPRRQEFVFPLKDSDLTKMESQWHSSNGLQAKLTCANSDCSETEVIFTQGEKKALARFKHTRFRVLAGEAQKDCAIPLFFDYEFDEVFAANPSLKQSIEQLERITAVAVTKGQVTSWDQEATESMNMEFFAGREPVLQLFDSELSSSQAMTADLGLLSLAAKYSYGLIGEGKDRTLSHVKFHFGVHNPRPAEFCYHLPLVTDTLDPAARLTTPSASAQP